MRKHGASLWLQRRPRGLLALTDRLLTAYAHPANPPNEQEKERPEADPRITAQHRFFADWINSDRYLPPTAVTNTMARALLRFDLVTEARLTEREVPIPHRKAGEDDAA